MSFHSTLTAASAWPADLVTAGVVSTAAQVYTGRRPRDKTDARGEVWLERLTVQVSGDAQHIRSHAYRAHVRCRINGGPDKAGGAQVTAVEAYMRTIADRYHGLNPSLTGVSNVVSVSAVEEGVDTDPGDELVQDGTVLVTFYVKE